MPEHSIHFTSITLTKSHQIKPISPPTLTLHPKEKRIYLANANWTLKLKDINIEKSQHELLNRRDKSVVLTLSTDKLLVKCTLSNPNASTMRKLDCFLNELEETRARLTKKGEKERKSAPSKRLATVTPARIYMSPRKNPRRFSPARTRVQTQPGVRGNVVVSRVEAKEMKLPPKSPRNTTPTKFVDPRVKKARRVFSQEERSEDEDVEEEEETHAKEDAEDEDSVQATPQPKRKRLKIQNSQMKINEDSDVEFDSPVAKKRLRLSDEESPEDRLVWMGMNSGIEEEGEDGEIVKDEEEVAAKDEGENEEKDVTEDKENLSKKEALKAEKPQKTIHSFFSKQPPKLQAKNATSQSLPKSDTYGGVLQSSPLKTTKTSNLPTAPAPEPVLKQVQRTGNTSRYFSNVNKVSNVKNDIENADEDMYQDPVFDPPSEKREPRMINRCYGSKQPRINNPYFKRGLGRARIIPKEEASPAKRLDFTLFESSADRALGSGRKLQPPGSLTKKEAEKPTIPGIQNLGNTCYLSASLQTLFSLPHFLLDLYKLYQSQTKKEMPLTQSLLEVAVVIGVLNANQVPKINSEAAKSKLLSSKAANPSSVKKQMDVLTDKFAGYEQRDAHEFLSDLVDFLHEELVSEKVDEKDGDGEDKENDDSSGEVNSNEKKAEDTKEADVGIVPPTDDYFHLKVRVCLECDSCKYSRSKEEMYRHLSLDVGEDLEGDPWTVKRGLEQFFQPEKRELKCEKCSDGATATQTIEIISCPKALLLHFKRFIVTQEVRAPSKSAGDQDDAANEPPVMEMVLKKNKARINLEDSLSLPIFAHKPEFKLRGVVHHVGNTAFSGHYTSCGVRPTTFDAQDNEEQWVYFDDRVGVKKDFDYVALNEKNQRNCYMALYELK